MYMYNEEYNINFIKYKKQIKETFKSKINKYTLTQKGKLIFLTSGGWWWWWWSCFKFIKYQRRCTN